MAKQPTINRKLKMTNVLLLANKIHSVSYKWQIH